VSGVIATSRRLVGGQSSRVEGVGNVLGRGPRGLDDGVRAMLEGVKGPRGLDADVRAMLEGVKGPRGLDGPGGALQLKGLDGLRNREEADGTRQR
jgi:hypothetical protein